MPWDYQTSIIVTEPGGTQHGEPLIDGYFLSLSLGLALLGGIQTSIRARSRN